MSTIKEIFDALTSDSSIDGCDPDWRHEILANADPKDIRRVETLFATNTESETAAILGIIN